jgi:RNA recognition motif-containing protein
MDSDQDALDAIEELDGCEFDNSKIVVKKARPRDDNRNRNNYNRN